MENTTCGCRQLSETGFRLDKDSYIYKLLNQLFALVSLCSKIFYTLKLFTLIKTLKLITPTCFGPTGPSSESTSILAKVTTDR